jgi:alkylmercury lyase
MLASGSHPERGQPRKEVGVPPSPVFASDLSLDLPPQGRVYRHPLASTPIPTAGELADALVHAFVRLTPAEQHLVAAAYRLLATGRPAQPAAIGLAAGWDPTDVKARLATWPMVYLDPDGRLVGLMGLSSQRVSEHRVEIDRLGVAWAWCALDPLFIIPVLATTGRVTSKCPVTAETIRFTLGPDGINDLTPNSAVVSALLPDTAFDHNAIQTFCHFVHFFASPAAANQWTADQPNTFMIHASQAAIVGRTLAHAAFPTAAGGNPGKAQTQSPDNAR